MIISSFQDKISQTLLSSKEKCNYIEKINELENKCQNWRSKYNDLHNKYLQLEFKLLNFEKEKHGKNREKKFVI